MSDLQIEPPKDLEPHELRAAMDDAQDIQQETAIGRQELRHLLKLGVVGRHNPEALARTFKTTAEEIVSQHRNLLSAMRGSLLEDAAKHGNLTADILSLFASSRSRLRELHGQIEDLNGNYLALVKLLERFARQDPSDPVSPNIRAQITIGREIRLIHRDLQVEERHLMSLLKETGLLRELPPGTIERGAEASLDIRLLQEFVNSLVRVLREENQIDEPTAARVVDAVGRDVQSMIEDLYRETVAEDSTSADAVAVVAPAV